MSNIEVESPSESDEDACAWNRYVMGHAQSTFFQRIEWRRLLCRELDASDVYLCARREGKLVGLLPLVEMRSRLFGASLSSLPFCSYAGPLADDAAVMSVLIDHAVREGQRRAVRRVELRALQPMTPNQPRQLLYSTFRAPIPQHLEDMKGIPQKRRNVVRRAVSLGLVSTVNRDSDRFFELYAENARAHGTPALGKRFFRSLLATFPTDSDILFVSDAQGRDLSAILCFYHRGEVLAYFAGEVAEARGTNANDFKYWSLMKHAVTRGCTHFDFGRSKEGTGSYQFKRLWGFVPQQLHYEYPYLPDGNIPQNNPSNPKFRLAMLIWQRLPRAIVDQVGPILAARLG
jgi:FemAB-related protein (PEP-CTERM system-associated)